jgi:hypothetical protein
MQWSRRGRACAEVMRVEESGGRTRSRGAERWEMREERETMWEGQRVWLWEGEKDKGEEGDGECEVGVNHIEKNFWV